jgi:hypothetical protein
VKALAMLPKRKYFRPASAERRLCSVEGGQDIERETGQLEPYKNHEQFFAPDEQHEADSGEENDRYVFASLGKLRSPASGGG